jgi:predicted P-loop ATPase
MNQQITLTVSDNVWLYAKAVATQKKQRIEEVLSDWLEKVSSEIDVEKLSDAEVIALAELKMPAKQQKVLHKLLEKNGEGDLTNAEKKQLDVMMEIYENALLRKSQALRVAVERGLMPPLSSE